jgi:hypothetical protein
LGRLRPTERGAQFRPIRDQPSADTEHRILVVTGTRLAEAGLHPHYAGRTSCLSSKRACSLTSETRRMIAMEWVCSVRCAHAVGVLTARPTRFSEIKPGTTSGEVGFGLWCLSLILRPFDRRYAARCDACRLNSIDTRGPQTDGVPTAEPFPAFGRGGPLRFHSYFPRAGGVDDRHAMRFGRRLHQRPQLFAEVHYFHQLTRSPRRQHRGLSRIHSTAPRTVAQAATISAPASINGAT